VSESQIAGEILRCAGPADLEIGSQTLAKCAVYLELLSRWNRRMNLTSLPLGPPIPSSTINKLVIEPLIAADLMPNGEYAWADLGSGGGSPALPLRLARTSGSLTMVESRSRKCAFLREASRVLELERVQVVVSRFDEMAVPRPFDVVTVRAVRIDGELSDLIASMTAIGGRVICFGSKLDDKRFTDEGARTLPDGSSLVWLRRSDTSS
jgi:16S rRNA (guanine527-N7)-methyltransferase